MFSQLVLQAYLIPEHEQAQKASAARRNMVHYIDSGPILVMVICTGQHVSVLGIMVYSYVNRCTGPEKGCNWMTISQLR
jgi:nucleoside diphosphate kinase